MPGKVETGDLQDGQDDVVLHAGHVQIFDHALDLCIANVGSVDVADQVEKGEHRHEAEVDLEECELVARHRQKAKKTYLAEDLLPLLIGIAGEELCIDRIKTENAEAGDVDGLSVGVGDDVLVVDGLDVVLLDGAPLVSHGERLAEAKRLNCGLVCPSLEVCWGGKASGQMMEDGDVSIL
jgi:hypothetical protein